MLILGISSKCEFKKISESLNFYTPECASVCVRVHVLVRVSSKEQVVWAVGRLNPAFSFLHQLILLLPPSFHPCVFVWS